MEMNFASKGVANTGLGLGIAGTSLGILSALSGGLRGMQTPAQGNYVSQEVFDVQMQLVDAQKQNAILASDLNTEKKIVEAFEAAVERENKIRNELNQQIYELDKKVDSGFATQAVLNANVNSTVTLLQNQVGQLFTMTKLVIPGTSICPTVTTGTTAT